MTTSPHGPATETPPPAGLRRHPDAIRPAPGETCVTCSDLAVAAVVRELRPSALALVDTGSRLTEVSVALVTAEVGDRVLIHAGEAIGLLPADRG